MRHINTRLVLTVGFLVLAASTEGRQHHWTQSTNRAGEAEPARPITISPRAIFGASNGIYCPDMSENAVGMHDLGWLPAGINVQVTVAVSGPATSTFDPVAAVVVAGVGATAGGTVKTTTFYDNDSGGGKDPKITLVTPQKGTYFLLIGENSGSGGGCYRYQVSIS